MRGMAMMLAAGLPAAGAAAQEPPAGPLLVPVPVPPTPDQAAPVIVPSPGPEANALALELARSGTLAVLLPLTAANETEQLVAAHPELTPAERAQLRETAQAVFQSVRNRLFAATAHEYARRLTLAELRELVAMARLPASQRLRQVQPAAIVGSMTAMAGLDFKGEALAAFCRETGKGCAKAGAAK